MRFKRTSSFDYIEFIRPNPSSRISYETECECGIQPANHFHKPYKWFQQLTYLEQLQVLEKENR